MNLYLNCDYGNTDSLVEYKSNISFLEYVVTNNVYDDLIIAGDFNCDPSKGRFFNEMNSFTDNYNLFFKDIELLPYNSFSFVSRNAASSTSWLDHIVTMSDNVVIECNIHYAMSQQDHIPIEGKLVLGGTSSADVIDHHIREGDITDNCICACIWDKASRDQVDNYTQTLEILAEETVAPPSLSCYDTNCNNPEHINDIKVMFSTLHDVIKYSESNNIPMNRPGNKRAKLIPGWNEHCKTFHSLARVAFLKWMDCGKPRFGQVFEDMKDTRKQFKYALRTCKKNEKRICREKFFQLHGHTNKSKFWKEIRKLNPKVKSTLIDGCDNDGDACRSFERRFRDVIGLPNASLNEPPNSDNVEEFSFIDTKCLDVAIDIKVNMGTDINGIDTRCVKYAGPRFRKLVLRFLKSCLRHGFTPEPMLYGCIKPILKDGKLCKTKSENYRPIMSSSVFLKILEYMLLPIMTKFLKPNDRQMGYTEGGSCTATVALAKETIMYYNRGHSDVHAAFVDMSKAYDFVSHDILFEILEKSSLPRILVRIIKFMYKNSWAYVTYNGVKGKLWRVHRGTRQGGILSPLLFNVYIKSIIEDVLLCGVGCQLNYYLLSILVYADDILLLAPSVGGLQLLLDYFCESILKIGLKINVAKSKYLVFEHRKGHSNDPVVRLQNQTLDRVTSIKYLGIVLSEDMSITKDVDRMTSQFLAQFNGMYYKFNVMEGEVIFYLFRTFTSSFYGVELWYINANRDRVFNRIAVAYHKMVKKITGYRIYDSNHRACDEANVDIFKHLQAKRSWNFFRKLTRSNNRLLLRMKYYLINSSIIKEYISKMFELEYGLSNPFENPKCAVMARIDFIQRNEPRSDFLNIDST